MAYPLYILCENGKTFLIYVSVLHSPGNIRKLLGPLPMHLAAADNYGHNACGILCLPYVSNFFVIAAESGMLCCCVVLQREEDDQSSEKSWDCRADFIPSLHVLECAELEVALKLAFVEDDPSLILTFLVQSILQKSQVSLKIQLDSGSWCTVLGQPGFINFRKVLDQIKKIRIVGEVATEQKCSGECVLCMKHCHVGSQLQFKGSGPAMICTTSTSNAS